MMAQVRLFFASLFVLFNAVFLGLIGQLLQKRLLKRIRKGKTQAYPGLIEKLLDRFLDRLLGLAKKPPT